MNLTRRDFFKLGGMCAIGLSIGPLAGVFAKGETPAALTGKRWAMAVDVKKCRDGCSDCADACHALHNVPRIENVKEEVKWIWTEKFEHAFPEINHEFLDAGTKARPFPILCNHCENPSCVRVCPTKATFQRDGIVMMDYHRCTGCRYCMAACPYGARSFNFRDPRPSIPKVNAAYPTRTKGVVEKCNFCDERLAAGLLPACVESCKNGALIFGDLNDPQSAVRQILREKNSIRRKEKLGTQPKVFYLL